MCVYCAIGDNAFIYNPPWPNTAPYPTNPLIPPPANPYAAPQPWDLGRLQAFQDLLRRVKELEEKVGCDCEPNKADYLKLVEERIAQVEREQKKTAETMAAWKRWHEANRELDAAREELEELGQIETKPASVSSSVPAGSGFLTSRDTIWGEPDGGNTQWPGPALGFTPTPPQSWHP